jgi:hypothetical protein
MQTALAAAPGSDDAPGASSLEGITRESKNEYRQGRTPCLYSFLGKTVNEAVGRNKKTLNPLRGF